MDPILAALDTIEVGTPVTGGQPRAGPFVTSRPRFPGVR